MGTLAARGAADAAQRARRAVAGVLGAGARHLRQVHRVRPARRQQRRGRHPRARRAGRRAEPEWGARTSSASRSCSACSAPGCCSATARSRPRSPCWARSKVCPSRAPGSSISSCRSPPSILIALFLVQRHGTGRIGIAFGPVMLIWFVAIGAIGLRWIVERPGVLAAVNPCTASFPREQRPPRVSHRRPRVPGRHRRRGAVRGHGPLRQMADPRRVVHRRAARPAAQLLRPGRAAAVRPMGTVKNPFYATRSRARS